MTQQIVIAGGGVVGAACAYYLSQKGIQPIVLEACSPACSASGKAGGFLARDWCDGNALGPLARTSFALHADLAKSLLPTDVGYRRVRTHSVAIRAGSNKSAASKRTKMMIPPPPEWVDGVDVCQSSLIGDEDSTAQVNPELLTKALLHEVVKRGGSVRERTKVVGLKFNAEGGAVEGVRVRSTTIDDKEHQQHDNEQEEEEDSLIPVDKIIFALGVWTAPTLRSILPQHDHRQHRHLQSNLNGMSGLKVHSMVVEDPEQRTTADALFLTYHRKDGGAALEPEVYPRPDESIYICGGLSSEEEPPALADEIETQPEAVAVLKEVAAAVSGELSRGVVLREQACFLPCSDDGLPLIGALPGSDGMYIATGHSCWGILNSLATGLGMAELIIDGAATSVDLTAFDPAR